MLALSLHPSETRTPRHRISAAARRVPGSAHVTLRFEVQGADEILWPKSADSPVRRDELWKTTCLESFVAVGFNGAGASEYEEFNFSPSGDWAAYRFDSYRAGMKNAEVETPHAVRRESSRPGVAVFEIDFSLSGGFDDHLSRPLAISLTAVMVEKSDSQPFYWALSHVGSKPDFHLRESFSLELE